MKLAEHTVEINDMAGTTLTVEVNAKLTRQFWIRYYLALWLIKLAGRVLRTDLEILEHNS